jgi:AcrR family transcriptional regulator
MALAGKGRSRVANRRHRSRDGSGDPRAEGGAVDPRGALDTRGRILDIALELFSVQGYAGTSIVDIAGRLGTTTAALYYHFKSKADILETLFAEPIAAYGKLGELAAGNLSTEELLSSFLDMTVNSRELLSLIAADPSIRSLLDERLAVKPAQMIEGIIARLAGPDPDRQALIRAHVAYAVIKDGVSACLSLNGSVTPEDRTEILDAALRVLKA